MFTTSCDHVFVSGESGERFLQAARMSVGRSWVSVIRIKRLRLTLAFYVELSSCNGVRGVRVAEQRCVAFWSCVACVESGCYLFPSGSRLNFLFEALKGESPERGTTVVDWSPTAM